jgi:hypothetical protein
MSGGSSPDAPSAGDHAAAADSSSLSSRSLLSRTLSSSSSAARGHGAAGEAHAGDGSLVSADRHASRLGLSDSERGDAGARATAGAAANAAGDDGGALGRSPFDTRSAAGAGSGFGRGRGRSDGGSLSDGAWEQDAPRLWARLAAADRRDRESTTRDGDLDDPRVRDGALLSRDRGLAMRLGDEAAMRGEDGRSRGSYADGRSSEADVTVNVTIGRVEVRAVQASASPGKPARARGPQPVALDDYLTQRGGAR